MGRKEARRPIRDQVADLEREARRLIDEKRARKGGAPAKRKKRATRPER